MKPEILSELESYLNNFKKGRQVEMIQPLRDLGYLSVQQGEGIDEISQDSIEQAVRQFRTEYEAASLIRKRFSFYEPNDYEQFAFELNTIELDFIHYITSLEGEFKFTSFPEMGELSLKSRMLHFRLNLLGLYGNDNNTMVENPVSDTTLASLSQLQKFLHLNLSQLELANLTGNLPGMEFMVSLISNPSEKLIYIPDHKDNVENIFKTNSISPAYNNFLSRLFQLYLWTQGLYGGKIDGEIKEMTTKSIEDLVSIVNSNPSFKSHHEMIPEIFFGRPPQAGFQILNISDLIKLLPTGQMTFKGESGTQPNNYQSLSEMIRRENIELDKKDFTPERIDEIFEDSRKNFSLGRRIYFSCRRILHIIGKGIKWFFEKVSSTSQKVWNLIKDFFKLLFKEIRTSLSIFVHGLKFLFGDRKIDSKTILTDFDLDCDAICIIYPVASSDEIGKHIEKCNYYINSLNVSLGFTGIILNGVLYSWAGPLNFIHLFIRLAEEFKKIKKMKLQYQAYL
jgi:hypothetical protein